jgi:O-antigen/teichoic acid export membrane protein
MNKAKEVLSSGKDLAIVLGYVAAVVCIVVAGFKLKAKADGDQQVKVIQIIILFLAAIILVAVHSGYKQRLIHSA